YANVHALPVKDGFYYGIIFLIAAGSTIIPMYLNVYALDGLTSSTPGLFIYLNPILSFILAILYFKDAMTGVTIVAYSLVFLSVVLFNLETLLRISRKHRKVKI